MEKVTHFTILGERCSGTNYIEHLILNNFDITLTWKYGYKQKGNASTHKHFFGFSKDYSLPETDGCLFVCIVRDPYEWIGSLYSHPHHLSGWMLKDGWDSFLTHSFYSMHDKQKAHGRLYRKERTGDRNIYTKKRYKNIFDARATKARFMLQDMPKLVKNCVLLRYEDVRDNINAVLTDLEKRFGLKRKHTSFKRVDGYKGQPNKKYKPVRYKTKIPAKHLVVIQKGLDWDIERKLGYGVR